MQILGIDVGGSGIKGAPVDTDTGQLLAERVRIKTPKSAEPEPMAEIVKQIAGFFNWNGPIGIGFPAPIKGGVAMMAANISPKWIGVNADDLFTRVTGCDCTMINDADAAGLAEMAFGAGHGQPGTVIMVTLGTGIGSAIFYRGVLLPKSIENIRQKFATDAFTIVADSDFRTRVALPNTHNDATATRSELDRVGQQIDNHLLQPARITRHPGAMGIDLLIDGDRFCRGSLRHAFEGMANDLGEFDRLQIETKLSGGDAGNV